MNDSDKKQFAVVMWGVAEDFGGKLSKEGLKMRFSALKEYSIEQVSSAGTWLLKNREKTYPAVPTTKEFIDVIEGRHVPKISAESRAEIQANLVLDKLYREGAAAKVDFEDPVTLKLMTGRWSFFRWGYDLTNENVPWWKKEFIAAYKAEIETEVVKMLSVFSHNSDNIIPIGNLKKLTGAKTI